jgi:fused signal recognition particle receptor
MFDFLKKKLKEVFSKTKRELEQETKEEAKELKEEVKEIEKEEKEVKKEIKEAKEEIKEIKKEDEKESELEIEEEIGVAEKAEEAKELEEKKEGFFAKLKKTFTTTKITDNDFERFFSELELALIENNVAMEAIDALKKNLRELLVNREIKRGKIEEEIKESLEKAISDLLLEPFDLVEKIKTSLKEKKPYVITFFGINGVGKTLTIAKITHLLKKNNLTVTMAAADTFRAAAIEQLAKHADNLGVEMTKHKYGADPAAVAFDAIAHAKSHGIDVVLIDTAGRMHAKANLMREMEKIIRVSKPDLKIFVGESIAGNDVIEQAKAFDETAGIDAIILTKADVDERGGACISVSHVTGKPILFLGAGQEYGELKKFGKREILKNIFC